MKPSKARRPLASIMAVRHITLAVAFGLIYAAAGLAQDRPARNPLGGDPEAIRTGTTLFNLRCASCHGLDAKGVRGPDLTALWAAGTSDDRLFQIVRRGIPGTEMPASFAPESDIWAILAYLRMISTAAPDMSPAGNAENGARLFRANCLACHQLNGRGGNLGPDLSRIGASRSRTALTRKIRTAGLYFVPGYEPVTVVTRDGRRVRGAKKNEDAFSIQIMDTRERLQGYRKNELREIVAETASLMPDFSPARLNEQELDDLLRYLGTLRGPDAERP